MATLIKVVALPWPITMETTTNKPHSLAIRWRMEQRKQREREEKRERE
jgi:hypothetical protein